MALNFGSLFSALARVLPGYVEGQRQAIQDNWQDLKNYNDIQAGQFNNAFAAATWDPRLANVWNQAAVNAMNTELSGMNLAQAQAAHPGIMSRNWWGSFMAMDHPERMWRWPYDPFAAQNAAAAMRAGGYQQQTERHPSELSMPGQSAPSRL